MSESVSIDRLLGLLEKLEHKIRVLEDAKTQPIAIVGTGCRMPGGVTDLASFWDILDRGVDAVRPIPESRWDVDAWYDPDPEVEGKMYVREGGFLDDPAQFDPRFFGISPREAQQMDPQHRLLLETSWEALEDAGIVPRSLIDSGTGVFVGIGQSDYATAYQEVGTASSMDAYAGTGTGTCFAAGRVSYVLGLNGPTVAVDTACSSSLVSIHLACQSLRAGECDLALAGGVHLMLSPFTFVYLARTKALSADGRCKSFSQDADGFGRGEGCAMLALQRLPDAIAAGRPILAVIRGSAVNHDGKSSGLTVPNGASQQAVLRQALANAKLTPTDVQYVEAHGTGTALGDPIEAKALEAVYGKGRAADAPLLIGSVKTNIGHLESAAGAAGVLKVAMALKRRRLPAHLHAETLNPRVAWADVHLEVIREARPWPATEAPRRAAVSSFGMSGTNAHVVLEEAPPPPEIGEAAAPPDRTYLVPISGQQPAALEGQMTTLAAQVRAHPEWSLRDVAFSQATTRSHLDHRIALRAHTTDELLAGLLAPPKREGRGDLDRHAGKTAFLFSGAGAERRGMGRQLYATQPVFRKALDTCALILTPLLARPLKSILFAEAPSPDVGLLDEADSAHPALFALQYALQATWRAWRVVPDYLLGLGVGELAAACAAGVFSLEDGLKLAAARGRFMAALPLGGSMVVARAPESAVRAKLIDEVSVAAVNGPLETVLSGSAPSVAAVVQQLEADGVQTIPLDVTRAYHCRSVAPMLDGLRRVAEEIRYSAPTIGAVSTVEGAIADRDWRTPDYWVEQAVSTVHFADGVSKLRALGVRTFVEIGPQPRLLAMGSACPPSEPAAAWLPSMLAGHDETDVLLDSLSALYRRGVDIDWDSIAQPWGGRRVRLPTYAFHRQRYWFDEDGSGGHATSDLGGLGRAPERYALAGTALQLPGDAVHHVLQLGPSNPPYLADHQVYGRVVVPGAFYLAVVLAAAAERWGLERAALEDVQFVRPLILDHDVKLHVLMSPLPGGSGDRFTVSSEAGRGFVTHAEGRLVRDVGAPTSKQTLEQARSGCTRKVSVQSLFEQLSALEIEWGPRWRFVTGAWCGDTATLVAMKPTDASVAGLHPSVIDNSFASGLVTALDGGIELEGTPQLPFAVSALRWFGEPTGQIWCRSEPRDRALDVSGQQSVSDLVLWDDTGRVIAEIDGFVTRRAPQDLFLRVPEAADELPLVALSWRPLPPITGAIPAGRWLVFASTEAQGRALTERLEAAGMQASLTLLDAVAQPDLAVFEGLDEPVDGVLCWFGAGTGAPPDRAQANAVTGLHLAQAVLRMADRQAAPTRWLWVTSGAQALDGESPDPAAAALWGLGRVWQTERPELSGVLLDVNPSASTDEAVDTIVHQIAAADGEPQVLVRGGHRHGLRLLRPDDRTRQWSLRSEGTVLVTGGLGFLGLLVARWLVEEMHVRHVVLLGRSAPEPEVSEVVRGLAAEGAKVSVVSADVTDRAALQRVLDGLPADLPLRGVIHAAGVLDDGTLPEQTAARFERVLRPKVQGAWNLHELTKTADLDLFVLFSSAASVLGAGGQSNYAAANAFLDALAQHRVAAGLPATSINWGQWSVGGMTSGLRAADRARLERQGMLLIEPADGLDWLDAALRRPQAQIGVVPMDHARLSTALGRGVPALLSELTIAGQPLGRRRGSVDTAIVGRLARMPKAERSAALQIALRTEAARILGLSGPGEVPADKSLQELGLDSLMAVEVRNAVSDVVGRPLPATLLFDYPTIDGLSQYLLDSVLALGEPTAAPLVAAAGVMSSEPIAIIGMGCRFPGGVTDPESFWRLLEGGVDAITEVPRARWDVEALYDPNPDAAGKMSTRSGGFVDDVDLFDPAFFDIAPREARAMDPQQRLLLETSWEALERAGVSKDRLVGSATGVFFGIMSHDYERLQPARLEALDGYVGTGNLASIASGRLSYLLGLKGPSLTLDTACSSSLVATHLACQSLRSGECELAIVGGATLILTPALHVEFSRLRGLSPDGRCKSFDASADGVGWSEGCGAIVLKRLSEAVAADDPIEAVILGSAVNQDGRSQGMTAPNGPSQQAVIRSALAQASLTPSEVDYVEAHGTGTTLGDPIEALALGSVFAEGRSPGDPLIVGSVKSNIGHTQAAAGVAGIIKAAMAVRRGKIPRSLHLSEPSSHVPWDELPLRLADAALDWPQRQTQKRTAGVSAFGISGTNAHVVLAQPPVVQAEAASASPRIVAVSARTAAALDAQVTALAEHVASRPELALSDVALTSTVGRSHFERRVAVVCETPEALHAGLQAQLQARRAAPGEARKLAFIFSGNGGPYAGMGQSLYGSEPVFRAAMDRSFEAAGSRLSPGLDEVLLGGAGGTAAAELHRLDYREPALVAVGFALSELWRSWGVRPDAVLGYGLGELPAACACGVFSLDDGLGIAIARSRLRRAEGTALMSVALAAGAVERAIAANEDRVSIAAVNGPNETIVAGGEAEIQGLASRWASDGVMTIQLAGAHAPCAPLGERALADLGRTLGAIDYHEPLIPFVSTTSGDWATGAALDAAYWREQLNAPVQFAGAIETLDAFGVGTYLEVGPHPSLLPLASACLPADAKAAFLPSLIRGRPETTTLYESVARYYAAGGAVDWAALTAPHGGRRVSLPTYAFQRVRCWVDSSAVAASADEAQGEDELWRRVQSGRPEAVADLLEQSAELSEELRAALPELIGALSAHRSKAEREARLDRCFYAPVWRYLSGGEQAAGDASGTWLLLSDAGGVLAPIAEDIEASGGRCLAVDSTDQIAEAFAQHDDIRDVLCGWGMDVAEDHAHLARVLAAAQAVIAAVSGGGTRLWLLTSGAVSVGPSDPLRSPEQAMVWGLGRVVSLEHPDLWGGLIDLAPVSGDAVSGALAAMTAPLSPAGEREDHIALRDSGLFVQRVRKYDLPSASPVAITGTALITGGLGALGLHVARHLAASGVPQVVLLSRRGMDAPGAEEAVASVQALGAKVVVGKADVTDAAAVAEVLARIEGPPLTAVFHAAGLAEVKSIADLDADTLASGLAAKVTGTRVLSALAQDLEAFVCFSSIASVWGSAGQGAYAAANAYLDAWAHARRSEGLPAMSVNYGPWASDGLATSEARDLLAARGIRSTSPDDAVLALSKLMAARATQVAVADVDWPRLRSLYEVFGPRSLLSEMEAPKQIGQSAGSLALRERLAALPINTRNAQVVELLAEALAGVLGFSDAKDVDPSTGFFDLGMDSLMAVELKDRVAETFGVTIPSTAAFNYPNAEALGGLVVEMLGLDDEGEAPKAALRPVVVAAPDQSIAIVGMGCRFPGGVSDPESYWTLLDQGIDAIGPMPVERFDPEEWFDPDPDASGKMYVREAGFISDVDRFDPQFFGISPREAVKMDPQQRLLLEVSWEALEHARIVPGTLAKSRTGVFVGAGETEYGAVQQGSAEDIDAFSVTGSHSSFCAGRVSYVLGTRGPSMTVDTACSSSLVALHLAYNSLRNGECDLALAGGIRLMLSPAGFVFLSRIRALAPDSRCRTFSGDAEGFGRGEGCGMVVLERLADAKAAGHKVLAVIRGSATTHDGRTGGLIVPSSPSQQSAIRDALHNAGVAPNSVQYVECHGTGTKLGDPIEVESVAAVYSEDRPVDDPVLIGAVKTNIGHLEPASGVAGLIKVVLALQHQRLPKSLHFSSPNPHIPWASIPVEVVSEAMDWASNGGPRRAGVSSFGMSGTNAHLVVEEAPPVVEAPGAVESAPPPLLVVSGDRESALNAQAARLREHMLAHPELSLRDVAYSLATSRTHFSVRAAITAESRAHVLEDLAEIADGGSPPTGARTEASSSRGKVAFLFTGQGSQRLGMGRGLYEASGVFRRAIDHACGVLVPHLELPLLDVMFGSDTALLDEPRFIQPAMFAFEGALWALWQSWGVQPDLLLGHSGGELSAACAAGVFSVEDGLALVAARGRLMHALPLGGTMFSVRASEAATLEVVSKYAETVSIAAINGPEQTVISGVERDAVAAAAEFEAQGIETRCLEIRPAGHSPLIDPMLDELRKVAESITYHAPEHAIISTVDPRGHATQMASSEYWVDNARKTVRFAEGMRVLEEAGARTYLEVGPKSTLLGAGRGCVTDDPSIAWLPSLRKDADEWPAIMATLAKWYVAGGDVDWAGVEAPYGGRLVDLPTYAFRRRRFWLEVERALSGTAVVRAVGEVEDAVAAPALPSGPALRERLLGLPDHERLQAVRVAIQEAVARILGLRYAADVPCDRPLNEIGFNSLLAIELRNQLSALIDAPLAPDVVLANPTVADQAAFISARLADLDVTGDQSDRWQAERLVPLRREGEADPLFLVHPFYGGVEVFAPLVQHLAPGRPVYAFRARGVAPDETPHGSMDEFTDAYLAAMQTVQGEGPYTIAGYSAGGVIAYELARKLEAIGQRVQLVLLDTWTFEAMRELSTTMAFQPGEGSALLLTAYAHGCDVPLPTEVIDADEAGRLVDAALQSGGLPLTRDDIARRARVSVAVIAALLSVGDGSDPIAAPILAIHSSGTTDDDPLLPVSDSAAARSIRWAQHTTGSVSTRPVPGDHFSMMAEPNVLDVAAALSDLAGG